MIMTQEFKINFRLFKTILLCLIFFSSCKDNKAQVENHAYTNDLIGETSPYLLQHAHNPVDWRPWSGSILDEAAAKDKLVIISIGYSSCHWCHVMEEETFEDPKVAEVMNKDFISVKVDREERPDVDQVYQDFLRGVGTTDGWPANIIALPNGKPLYGGTYHTNEQWRQVLTKFNDLYKKDPEEAKKYGDMVALGIQEMNIIEPAKDFASLTLDKLDTSVNTWKSNWDLEWGGDQGLEKRMLPSNLSFLMDYAILTDDKDILGHIENTLDQIAGGGMYDHVGGGLYRYSTDSQWKVPHFEKMLYDNAQVLSLFSKAYKIFEKPTYKQLVFQTISFLEREMKNPEGGYYAALDSQSEGEEGKFYLWQEEELKQIIQEDFELFATYYNIAQGQDWENGNYILHTPLTDEEFIGQNQLTLSSLNALKEKWKKQLLTHRDQRIRPKVDDKIITSWNALLINGLVDAYSAFGDPKFLDRAKTIYEFLQTNGYKDGQLVHSYKKGSKWIDGFLEDYAFLASASLNLYSTTLDGTYLTFAQNLNQTVMGQFVDEPSGMFRYNKNSELISKIIKTNDGVMPSPNAVMAHNLFQLGHLQYDKLLMNKSKKMLSSMMPNVTEYAQFYAKWGALLVNNAIPYYEIAVVGKDAGQMLGELQKEHLPNTLIVGSTEDSELPLFAERYTEDGTLIYVCRDNTCKLPVDNVKAALDQLRNF